MNKAQHILKQEYPFAMKTPWVDANDYYMYVQIHTMLIWSAFTTYVNYLTMYILSWYIR